jgi:protocatechuate 3,4-dioxygenase, beta subunit
MRLRLWPFVAALLLLAPAMEALGQQGPPPTPDPPSDVSSTSSIAAAGEPGQKLVVSGQTLAPDGKTPASGVIVYAYQTDATGEYHNNADRIARLHGWTKSDAQGRFEFHTIRPGPYPGRTIPAHIHMHVWGAGYPLQWTADVKFADDPLLSARDRAESDSLGAGFGNICAPKRAGDGAWHCAIRLRLQRDTNYPAQYRDDPRTRR